jgi:non-heme chloroperoxidase
LDDTQNGAETLKEFALRLAPAPEAFKVGDTKNAIPLFVDGVGGPGAYDRRSAADKNMNADNTAS